MTLFVLLIFTTIIFSTTLQYKLESDKTSKGIILFPSGKCNMREDVKSISYALNLTILQELIEGFEGLDQSCISEHGYLKKFHKKTEEIKHIKSSFKLENIPNNVFTIESFIYSNLLREELDIFNKMSSFEQCFMIYNLTLRLTRIYNEIDKLSNKDFSSIYTILSEDRVKKDVANLLNDIDQEKYYFPFSFSHTFFKDFLSHANFSLQFKDKTMYITFFIPIYKSFNTFTFIPKPIFKNGTWHSIKTDMRFIIFNHTKIILFNEHDWHNSCFIFNKIRFCTSNPIKEACDQKFFVGSNASDADFHCFQEHKSKDLGLQINSTIYFLTYSNTVINLKCNNGEFPITLNEPLILELEDCLINTPFFHFDNRLGNISYTIFSSSYESNIHGSRSYSIAGMIFLIIILSIMTLGPCIYAFYQM